MEINQSGASYRKLQVTSILFGVFGLAAFLASKFTNGRLIVILTVTGFIGFLITAGILAVKIKRFWNALGVLALDLLLAVAGSLPADVLHPPLFPGYHRGPHQYVLPAQHSFSGSSTRGCDGQCGGAQHHRTGWRGPERLAGG